MSWRRETAPKELLSLADAAAEVIRAAARYFREPSEPSAVSTKSRSRALLDAADAFKAALKARPASLEREDWLAVAKSLAELGENAGRAVAQAKLYEVPRQPRLIAMAQALKEAADELASALRRGLSAERLALAKRLASSVVEAARRARKDSLAGAGVVEGLRDQEIVRRLNEAAGAVHDAADRLAQVLSVR